MSDRVKSKRAIKRIIIACMIMLLLSGIMIPVFAANKTVSLSGTATKSGVKLRFQTSGTYSVYLQEPKAGWRFVASGSGMKNYLIRDEQLVSGRTYYFSAVKGKTRKASAAKLNANRIKFTYIKAPVLISATPTSESAVKVVWEPSGGARSYKISYKTPGKSWETAGYTKGTAYTVKGLDADRRYLFTVNAVSADRKRVTSAHDPRGIAATTLVEPPVIRSVKVNSDNSVSLAWSRTPRTGQYAVYWRKTGASKWEKLAETSKRTFTTATPLTADEKYDFALRSLDDQGQSISGLRITTVKVNPDFERYVVRCNRHYSNNANTLGTYSSLDEAIKAIQRQPAATRGQWFVYDRTNPDKALYPEAKTSSQKVMLAVNWAKAIASDSRHGYCCIGECSDNNVDVSLGRWGKDGDYSCSTLVAMAYEMADIVNLRDVTSKHHLSCVANGNTYSNSLNCTDFADACMKSGKFQNVTEEYKKKGTSALRPGDIMITSDKSHVAMFIGRGQLVEAAMNELGREFAIPRSGDQTGWEVCIDRVYGSWGTILRVK